jgi:hypothetical protein
MKRFIQYMREDKSMVPWSKLSHSDLRKRGGYRLEKFLNMVKDGDEFLTIDGPVVIRKQEYDRLFKEMDVAGYSTNIETTSGSRIRYPSSFYKTPEFGGKGAGSGTRAEDIELNSLNKQIERAKEVEGTQTIRLTVGNKTYEVSMAVSTPGTPKSDFHLTDAMGNGVVWISHKDGIRPKDIQQWGGISYKKEPWIFKHRETQNFINDLKARWPDGVPPTKSYYRKIVEPEIKFKSIYGQNYGTASYDTQNVTILLQGAVKLVKVGNQYKLDANHVYLNGKSFDNTPYEAVFVARHGDRSDAGVKRTRIVIMSIASRTMTGAI